MHNACDGVKPLRAQRMTTFLILRGMDEKAQIRREQADRLREARIAAGYETATAAAEALRESVATYTLHENGGRGFKAKAEKYGKIFGVEPGWLLWGSGGDPRTTRILRALSKVAEDQRARAEGAAVAVIESFAKPAK